jgi:catechol 2,3-dioxygenase-like lactoylglutathione lyase family enzyme
MRTTKPFRPVPRIPTTEEKRDQMTVQRMNNVGIVVNDLPATIAFFRELGLKLEGQATIEGEWAGRVTGLGDQAVEIAMMRTPDGHSWLELSRFLTLPVVRPGSRASARGGVSPQGRSGRDRPGRRNGRGRTQPARKRRLDNCAFFQADVGDVPRRFEGRFDLVYSCLAHHHYPDPAAAALGVLRSLRPGGVYCVIDPGPAWFNALSAPLGRLADPGWIGWKTPGEFRSLFETAGFARTCWIPLLPGFGIATGQKSPGS